MPSCSPCHACRHLYLSMCCTSRQGLVWRLVLALALYWCRALAALVRLGAVRLYLPRLHLMSTHSLARGQGLVWPGAAWPSPGRGLGCLVGVASKSPEQIGVITDNRVTDQNAWSLGLVLTLTLALTLSLALALALDLGLIKATAGSA